MSDRDIDELYTQLSREHAEQQRIFRKPRKHYTKRLIERTVKTNGLAWHYGFLFNLTSVWIGVHYSHENKRYCMNLIPCCTIWWTKKGGLIP